MVAMGQLFETRENYLLPDLQIALKDPTGINSVNYTSAVVIQMHTREGFIGSMDTPKIGG
jgi:hypothetical protein